MDKEYYYTMMKKDRLIPIIKDNHLIGFITYYIGNDDVNKYVRDDPWVILDDEPFTGNICYIDQMITNKEDENHQYSWWIFGMLLGYICKQYPQVQFVRWNRYKNNKHFAYILNIKNGGRQCIKLKS